MDVTEFDYDLPEEVIAQVPCEPRDLARLMVADDTAASPRHRAFRDLPALLREGDVLVLNDTRVLPARLSGRKATGGRVELLLLERVGGSRVRPEWDCLVRASRKPAAGDRVDLGGSLRGVVLGRTGETFRVLLEDDEGDPMSEVERVGSMPLPPYIRRSAVDPRSEGDRSRYQTVFSRHPGAVAAPTAGLHFTPGLLERLREAGVRPAWLTLHVGLGTFRPVRARRVEDHVMHDERFVLPAATAEEIDRARSEGGRVVAVGTTVVRTLEERATAAGRVKRGEGRSSLFIYPGFEFRVVDVLITNFHLPRSTLLMLVAAFVGRERILGLYRRAIDAGYRFYSYGDAMLLERHRRS